MIREILVGMACLMLVACDVDLFSNECREIGSSGYSLCRDDNGQTVFYLEPGHQAPSGGGVIDGTVKAIGWNDKVIVADRKATFRGDLDGLMTIDLTRKKVEGPYDYSSIAKTYPQIKLIAAGDAWSSLR